MKTVLCKITFYSPTNPEQFFELIGKTDIDQIMSEKNELVDVETEFLSKHDIIKKHSILHKADIFQIRIFKEKHVYTFDKSSLRLMSQIPNFKDMEA